MADYRCSIKPILSRSKGASFSRAAAYIAREALHDERTGQTFDYSGNKDKALWAGIFAPKGAPDWTRDLEKFSNEVERAEKRKDAQLARPIELSLPHELTLEQNKWLLQDYIKENFTRKGYATVASIHEPPQGGDERNIHAHLLVSLRTIDKNGFSKTKKQEQDNFMSRSERAEELRVSWEKHLKHHLERQGHKEAAAQISHKTLEAQGIEREPTKHLGPTASDMERKGKKTERGDFNRNVSDRNRQIERLQRAEKEVSQAITEALRQIDAETKQQQTEVERRAQGLREHNTATVEAIRCEWAAAQRDGIVFMIGLNERGLYVAQDQKGYYAVVEKNGFAHRLPTKDMQEAVDALRRENSGLIIPSVEEQRAEQQKHREQQKEERERERQRRAAHKGATLYDRADMASTQRDALRHIQDAHRQQEAERLRQEQEQKKQERESGKTKEAPRTQAEQKREDKKDRSEQTEYQQRRAARLAMSDKTDLSTAKNRERSDDSGRERGRER